MNKNRHLPTRATMTVNIQDENCDIRNGIQSICDSAKSLLNSEKPTKRQRKELLVSAKSLLDEHNSMEEQIPSLLPKDCDKYSIRRIEAESNHKKEN